MERSAIIQKIKVRMDELTPLSGAIDHPFEESFNSFLDEAHRQALNELPLYLLPTDEINTSKVVYDDNLRFAYVPVPENFMRINSFKFESWINPGIHFITQENPLFKRAEHGLVNNNIIKPFIVMLWYKVPGQSKAGKYFRCYAADPDSAEYLYYIKEGEVSRLDDKIADALAWLACSKIMQAFNMKEFQIAQERYREFLITNMR